MKTPRELILARHRASVFNHQPIRPEELAEYAHASAVRSADQLHQSGVPRKLSAIHNFWMEAIWPWHRAWLGMMAIWLILLLVNMATRESPKVARIKMIMPTPEIMAELREQEQTIIQLIGPSIQQSSPVHIIPGPRSDRQPIIILL